MESPECEKMVAVQEKSKELTKFVDWLREQGYAICEERIYKGSYPEEQWVPLKKSFEQLFADYFGIDLKKVEEERRALLEEIRRGDTDGEKSRLHKPGGSG